MKITQFNVTPKIPENLVLLEELAHDLWVSWNTDALMLFIRLDYDAWILSGQNPARMLGLVPQQRYEELSSDDSYLAYLEGVKEKYEKYKSGGGWYTGERSHFIAYFSMEYGLDVSLPIYSGGLGVLSGDHLKTSSDMGLPLVGVGLLYRQGYFRQYLNADGFQQESYPENDWYNMPVRLCLDEKGEAVKISVDMCDAEVQAQIWEARVGRTSLYLLDTNIEENGEQFRSITAALYGGDRENRMRQEILLGIGGIRALRTLGINPAVTHMNEGHSAFLGIERIREMMSENGLSFNEALHAVKPTNIFTTHTPVPAGNERFSIELMNKYFHCLTKGTGLDFKSFAALGRENPANQEESFCMTVLAMRLSGYNNGVSELHGEVSREMWKQIWPGLPADEVPIGSITNGVHPRSWTAENILDLCDRYFGPRFYDEPTNLEIWDRIGRISDQELWRAHERNKERLVAFARKRLKKQLLHRGAPDTQIFVAEEALSPYALTISFARRFATYKRANLLFRDPERLIKLLSDNERPLQLIFSGKAHPHDIPGKELIKEVIHFASRPEIRSKIVFLENYDISIARYLVSGSDVWLNNPRKPQEASGTSGMKAALNGVLNCSVPDGWWAEAYQPDIGWAIGKGEVYEDQEMQDEIESKALFDLLEREIIPLFYNRGRDGLPREWIHRMKTAMNVVGKGFSSHRMLTEYAEQFYLPALENSRTLSRDDYTAAKKSADYFHSLEQKWHNFKVVEVRSSLGKQIKIGDVLTVEALVQIDGFSPDEVRVQLYYGRLNSRGEVENSRPLNMVHKGKERSHELFSVDLQCQETGRQGFTVRILPEPGAPHDTFTPGYIKWA